MRYIYEPSKKPKPAALVFDSGRTVRLTDSEREEMDNKITEWKERWKIQQEPGNGCTCSDANCDHCETGD